MCTNMLAIVIFRTLSSLTEGYPQLPSDVCKCDAYCARPNILIASLSACTSLPCICMLLFFTHLIQCLLDILFSKNLLMRIKLYSSKTCRASWSLSVARGTRAGRLTQSSFPPYLTLTPLSTVHDPILFLSNDYKTVKYHDKQVPCVKSLIFLYHFDFPIRFRVRFHANYD